MSLINKIKEESKIIYTKVISINNIYNYNNDLGFIICINCNIPLKDSKDIINHLETHYKNKNELNNIKKQVIIKIDNLIINNTFNIKNIKPYLYYFKDLPEYKGYQCLKCHFLTLSYKLLRTHLNSLHSIKDKTQGKDLSFLKEYYIFPIILQTLTINKKTINYFITSKNIIVEASINNNILSNFKTKVKNIIKSNNNNKKDLTIKETTGFLYNSKFNQYFINRNPIELLELLENNKENTNFNIINLSYNLTLNLIPKLESIIFNINRSNLQTLNSEHLNSLYRDFKAFKIIEKETQKKYYKLIPKFIIYLLNIYFTNINSKGKEVEGSIKEPNIEYLEEDLFNILNILNQILENSKNIELLNKLTSDFEKIIILIIIKILEQDTKQTSLKTNSLFLNPILTYLILISYNKYNNNFEKEVIIQNNTSIIIYNFRLFFIGFLRIKEEEAIYNKTNFNFNNEFNIYFPLYLTNSSNNIFEEITQIRLYAKAINNNNTSENRVIDIDQDNISIDNKNISINSLKDLFKDLLFQLENILYKDLLFSNIKELNLNINNIKDDINNCQIGFSFINYYNKEQDLDIYKDLLINKLSIKESLISKTLIKDINNNNIIFKESNIKELFNNRTKFLELLLALIYMSSGAPIRGEEIILLEYFNTLINNKRNIFIEPSNSNLIRLTTNYYKSYNITRINKTNFKFLCPKLSNILKIYLLIFIPLYNYINIEFYKTNIISSYLFENKGIKYTSIRLSSILKTITLKGLGEEISINPYRHLIIYIIKNRINLNYNSDSSDLIEDIQANHSTKTSNNIYAREANISSNSNNSLIKKSLNFNIKFFEFFNLLNIINPNTKKHIRNTSSINISNKKYKVNNENLLNRNLLTINNNNNSKSLLDYLKELFNNNNSTFKSLEQEEVINSIINKEPFITYINGTNSGKSLLFFLSYYINPNIIHLVITPRVSLKEDLYKEAIKLNLQCEIFNKNNIINNNLIFLGFEDLLINNLLTYINNLLKNKQEFIFFFDEAHLIILEEDFRYILKFISNILRFKTNIVFISATFPNNLLTLLEDKFNIINNKVIIGNTSRVNISYNIEFFDNNLKIITSLKELYLKLLKELKEDEKIIIFTSTVNNVKYISKELNIPGYYSDLENKDIILNNYKINNNNKGLVGTNAIGVGLNIPNIKYSIHPYTILSLINLDQEIGRIGRTNNPSYSYIFAYLPNYLIKDYNPNLLNLLNFQALDYNKVIELINEKICLRRILDSYFNNKITKECISPNLLCYLCQKRSNSFNISYNKEINKNINYNNLFNNLESNLLLVKNHCLSCLLDNILNKTNNLFNNHYLYNCSNNNSKLFITIVRDLEKYIKKERLFKKGSCCFQCFLPNKVCFNRDIKENYCIYQRYILEIIIFIYNLYLNKNKLNKEVITYLNKEYKELALITNIFNLARNISKPIIFNNCDSIYGINYIIKFNINYFITYLDNLKNNPNIINSSNKIFSLNTLFNITSSYLNSSFNNSKLKEDNLLIDLDNISITSSNNSNYNISSDFEKDLLNINIEDLEAQKIYNITLRYINFINKLEFYNYYCLFCHYNKIEFKNHNTFTCKYNIKDLEYINTILLKKINVLYTKSFKNINNKEDNNNLNSKSLYIDPCCLLPVSICIYYRANYKDNNKRRCGLNNIIITILFIIYKFKQSKDIPFNLYNQEDINKDKFWDYISNKGKPYYNLETSKAFEIISNFQVNKNDKVLKDY